MTQLTQHFSLEELTFSQTAARKGINNTPPPDVLARLKRTAQGMEVVRIALGGSAINISSGYRCPALNAAVGGAKNSQHLTGEACDFTSPAYGSVESVFNLIRASTIPFDQVILEYGRWVHISFSDKPRKQALVIDEKGTRPA